MFTASYDQSGFYGGSVRNGSILFDYWTVQQFVGGLAGLPNHVSQLKGQFST